MPIELLPTLLLSILVIGYTPGPSNLFAFRCSIRYGFRKSMKLWYGLLAGFCVMTASVAVIIYFLEHMLAPIIPYLKYAGAAYILYLAYAILKNSGNDGSNDRSCTFLSGFLLPLTTPKMILFDIMCFTTFVLPYSESLADLFKVGAILILAGPGANLAWIGAGAYLQKFFSKYGKQVDIVLAILMVGCAALLIFKM